MGKINVCLIIKLYIYFFILQTNKIGFKNYDENDPYISKLNSNIQILTSFEQIFSFFNNNKNAKIIRKFNNLS